MRGRHLGRRDADAPPAGDPARLDEAPARGRAGVGRADRGALGLRGVDLRPLRLRAGGPGHQDEVGLHPLRAPGRRGRLGPARRRRQGARALLAGLRARPRRPVGNALARRALVEGASARRPGELASRREHEVLRRRRDRQPGRGLRDLPRQGRVGGRLRPRRGARDRGARDVAGGREGALALPARDRPDGPGQRPLVRPRLAAAAARPRPARARPAARRRALAAARRPRRGAEGALVPARRSPSCSR